MKWKDSNTKDPESRWLNAVKQDGFTLQYVNNQTKKLCLAAVRNDGWALKFVKKQTLEIIEEALLNDKNLPKIYIKWDQLKDEEREYLKLKYDL